MSFEPRKKTLAYIARRAKETADRPLYAGVVKRKLTTHYGEGGLVSLPFVRWIDRR
jgi:hypothetical protein